MINKSKRKNLLILGAILIILLVITFLAIYFNSSAHLHDGLVRSLETFKLYSVSVPKSTEQPFPSIDLNISFVLRNLVDFSITVSSVKIMFYINNISIGQGAPSGEGSICVLPAKQNITLCFIRHITKSKIIEIIKNSTYNLNGNATITGYARYLFVTETHTARLSFSRTVQS